MWFEGHGSCFTLFPLFIFGPELLRFRAGYDPKTNQKDQG